MDHRISLIGALSDYAARRPPRNTHCPLASPSPIRLASSTASRWDLVVGLE